MPYCNFKNMRIALVAGYEYKMYVTNVLHKLGYKFCGEPEVYDNALAFFTYDNGIIMKTDDMEYFKGHPNEEYVLVGDELKKASEWFVQPATSTFEDKLTAAVAEKKKDFDALFVAKYLPPNVEWKIPLFTSETATKPTLKEKLDAGTGCRTIAQAITDEQITKQKAVADKILDKLFPIDPFALCAGGAPRDWHFGKPAADLDIFFHTDVEQLTIVSEMLRHVGIDIDNGKTADDLPEWYKLNPALKCVYSTVVDGVNVQLMLMNDKTHNSVIPHFPFSICKAWYKRGTINLERDFVAAERNKVVVRTSVLYNDEHKYVQKIKAKFPDWQFCDSWEEAYKHAFYNKGK